MNKTRLQEIEELIETAVIDCNSNEYAATFILPLLVKARNLVQTEISEEIDRNK